MDAMTKTVTVPFGSRDHDDLREFKSMVDSGEIEYDFDEEEPDFERHKVRLPAIKAGTEGRRKAVENALETGASIRRNAVDSLPPELVENAKAAFISSGGNISEVAALFDLTPDMVIKLASEYSWPVYGGSTKVNESMSTAQLQILKDKLWKKVLSLLNSLDVETKQKEDIVQHRTYSEYIEPLASRSSAFKAVMDQYMRVSTLLEPETFAADPDGTNFHARNARGQQYPGGIEGVNREMADLLAGVVVGVVDRARERDLQGYENVIDTRQVDREG